MILRDFIPTAPSETNLYIGAKSAYIHIGDSGEALEAMTKLSSAYHSYLSKTALCKCAETVKNAIIHIGVQHKKIRQLNKELCEANTEEERKGKEKELKQVKRRLEQAQHRLISGIEKANEICQTLSEFVDFLDREVIESYPRLADGIAVIIKGEENGRFWYLEEAENGAIGIANTCDDEEEEEVSD